MTKRVINRITAIISAAVILLTVCGCDNSSEVISQKLVLSNPKSDLTEVNTEKFSITGVCDPTFPLKLNGEKIKVGKDGVFSTDVILKAGENEFTVKSGNYIKNFTVNYSVPMILSYTPSGEGLTVEGGSKFPVSVVALCGCEVKARFNSYVKTLTPDSKKKYDGKTYCKYSGTLPTPIDYNKDVNCGTLDFRARHGEDIKIVYGSEITVLKAEYKPDYSIFTDNLIGETTANYVTGKSTGCNYAKVSTKYVAEVTSVAAETFNGNTDDDFSRPTNNYLPKGTVDYCNKGVIYNADNDCKYYLLRCNYRVYAKSKYIKLREAQLPEYNTIGFAYAKSQGNRFELGFNTDWKAPFLFDLEPQNYKNPKTQDYNISSVTYSYVDITFCYSAKILGDVKLGNNPLFKNAVWIKNERDYTLRLYLKHTGAFYGWSSRYDADGRLVFSFLTPTAAVKDADSPYGYSLDGIKILVDAGHGGRDGGTPGIVNTAKNREKVYNLKYAKELAHSLKNLGATVYMTRSDDTYVDLDDRAVKLKNIKPDLAVSIHFNAESRKTRGFFCGYFNPHSYSAAYYIKKGIGATGMLDQYKNGINWHYFRLCRASDCPVVLTENGFLDNPSDFKKIQNDDFCKNYVSGIVHGIVNYFVSLS